MKLEELKKIAYKIIRIFGDLEVIDGFVGITKEEITLDLVIKELEKSYNLGKKEGREEVLDGNYLINKKQQ